MHRLLLSIVVVLLVPVSAPVHALKESFHSLETREGVRQPFWLIEPENARKAVILFAGGNGMLDIDESGIGRQGNFLVRSRNLFAQQGFVVAVIDKPDDRSDLLQFRKTAEHARDVGGVIASLRQRHPGKPIWLVGTSRGTISAANAAAHLIGSIGPDGLVLTSSVTMSGKSGKDSLADVELKKITVPTLIVHHRQDECRYTPFGAAKKLVKQLSSVTVKEFKDVTGGKDKGDPCKGESYHGFLGIEEQVVRLIGDWIKAH